MTTGPVVKELGQLWRLLQYTWQQKQGRVLLLSSMLVSITVMWCMASSILPVRTASPQSSELIALTSPVQLTQPSLQSFTAQDTIQMSSQQSQPQAVESKVADTSSASQEPSEDVSKNSSSDQDKKMKASLTAAMPAEHAVHNVPCQHAMHDVQNDHEAADAHAEHGAHRKVLQTDSIAQTVNPGTAKTGNAKPAASHSTSHTSAAATTASHLNDVSWSESSDELLQLEQGEKLNGMIASSSRAFGKPGKFAVTRDDLVAAIPTDLRSKPLIEGSKAWRKDMRTYLMINTSYVLLEKPVAYTDTEMWRAWRDDNETWATYWCEPWDPRVALTPFLAHRDFHGDYKWMLFGHDDTFFFVNNALDLLQDFDPDLPYVIADHFWWTDEDLESADAEKDFYHPSEFAPHCLPCHWDKEQSQRARQGRAGDMYEPFQPYPGCPCTLQDICKNDKRKLFQTLCDKPLAPLPIRMHIGAGALISRGFLEKVPLSFMEQCILDLPSAPSANGLLSQCIQQAGYGFTNPGHSFYNWDAKSFDPGPSGSQMLMQAFHDASSGSADEVSKERVSHVVSSHLEGQGVKGAAHTMLKLQSSFDNWRNTLLKTKS